MTLQPWPTHHFGEDVIFFDIDRIGSDLRRRVPIADMPGDAQEPQRIFGLNFQEFLRRRFNHNKPPIFELQRIAVIEPGGFIKIEQEFEIAVAGQPNAAPLPVLMIERDAIVDALGFHRELAHDGCGADHWTRPSS